MSSIGWKFLFNSRKEHYFIDGHSLCNKYLTLRAGGCHEDSDNRCKACEKKLEQSLAAKWVKELEKDTKP